MSTTSRHALPLAVLLLVATGPAAAQAKPFTLENVLTLVRNGATTARILGLVEPVCISFELTPAVERRLKVAGARPELLDGLATVCRRGASTKDPTPAPAPGPLAPPPPPPTPARVLLDVDWVGQRPLVRQDDLENGQGEEGLMLRCRRRDGECRYRLPVLPPYPASFMIETSFRQTRGSLLPGGFALGTASGQLAVLLRRDNKMAISLREGDAAIELVPLRDERKVKGVPGELGAENVLGVVVQNRTSVRVTMNGATVAEVTTPVPVIGPFWILTTGGTQAQADDAVWWLAWSKVLELP